MSSLSEQYVLASDRSGHDRLRMLCQIHDPRTRQLLLQAGLSSTDRYLEFGCGLGYVARWAATQAAHVTAVDLSEDHLAEAKRMAGIERLGNIEFVNASIYEHGLPSANFDFAYTRWVLVHLSRPIDAMRKMYEALKPGGLMVTEECDMSTLYTEPPSDGYSGYRDAAIAGGVRLGADYEGGRRQHLWAREAGFEIIHADAYQPHYLTGPHKGFWTWTFQEAAPKVMQAGVLTEERTREIAKAMRAADEDPNVLVGHTRTHQLIARKPG